MVKLNLPNDPSHDDSLMDNLRGLSVLFQSRSSAEDFAADLETWTQVEEMDELKELVEQEREHFHENNFIQSILSEQADVNSSNEEEPNCEPADIADLDVTVICSSLVDLQQLLKKLRVTAAAEYLEKARNEVFHACRMAKCKPAKANRQTFIDAFLKPVAK